MEPKILEVIPDDHERFTFKVESESGKDPYVVDLLFHKGHGKCNCKHFECRFEPEVIKDSSLIFNDNYRCKHIKAARAFAGEYLLNKTIAVFFNSQKTNRHD